MQTLMTDFVGVLRTEEGLLTALTQLPELLVANAGAVDAQAAVGAGVEAWETTNLVTIAIPLARAAVGRRDTRGPHCRDDFPAPDGRQVAGHLSGRRARK